jgi:hypothetical protein
VPLGHAAAGGGRGAARRFAVCGRMTKGKTYGRLARGKPPVNSGL